MEKSLVTALLLCLMFTWLEPQISARPSSWGSAAHLRASRLRNTRRHRRPPPPARASSVRPQLDGNMGGGARPRRLPPSRQYRAKTVAAPDSNTVAPGAIKILTDKEKEEMATAFFVTFNYSTNELSSMELLIRTMQRNYGLVQTGRLDEPTVTAMQKPRCGVRDKPASYNTFPNRERWQNKDVTYTIKGYTPDMSQCQVRNAFKRAFRVWEEVVDLNFIMVDSDDADMIIYFGYGEHGDGYPFDGANGLLAHAFTPGTEKISGDAHFDEGEFWTLGRGRVFDTYNGNSGGDPCVFPFYFQSKSYAACTSTGREDGLEWCATTSDYDRDKKWAFCPQETLFTYGGNGDNDPCVFPFVFLGKTYDSCTPEGRSDGYEWCSTTYDYDDDGKWGFCPKRAHGTEGGNAGGAPCKFPFRFQGYEYTECTTQGRTDFQLWCATTEDYDRDGVYGFCNGDGYSLFLVAAHEFGHAIGLDHSNQAGALMYPVYAYHENFALPDDDKLGARDLYGGQRRRSLPAIRLEECGGNLEVTESAGKTTPTPKPRVTTQPLTVEPSGCGVMPKPTHICENPIDAIMLLQEETLVFQGNYYWRVTGRGRAQLRQIRRIADDWRVVKCNVDAAYQRPYDEKIVFFKGGQYYEYDGYNIEAGYPRETRALGLPAKTVVDGVVYMATRNPRTRRNEERLYYFVQNKVYRANVRDGMVMREVSPSTLGSSMAWRLLPTSVDAVYRTSLIKPYTNFVKGKTYYRYENRKGRLDFSRHIQKLFRCPESVESVAMPITQHKK